MKNGAKVLPCSCCKKPIRVGMGVVFVLCGPCAKRGVGDLLAAKKGKK